MADENNQERDDDLELDENTSSVEDRPEAKERKLSPRELAIAAMEERIDQERGLQLAAEGVTVPGQQPQAAKSNAGQGTSTNDEAAADAETAQDPTSQFIKVVDGKVMVLTKVNGKEELKPITQVLADAQRVASAEERFQQASVLQRQAREDAARAAAERQAATQTAATRSTPDVDKATLLATSEALVTSLIHDDPKVAAQKLADVLANTQARGPVIDVDQIADVAAGKAKKQLTEGQLIEDMRSGLQKFAEEYPEIEKDPKLRAAADSISDAVEAEHPDWTPSQIILESGRRAREWVQSLSGQPAPEPAQGNPASARQQVSNRQARKDGLVPMPKTRTGQARTTEVEVEQTPQQIMAEIRKGRNQAHAV